MTMKKKTDDLIGGITESSKQLASAVQSLQRDVNLYMAYNNEALEGIRNRLQKLENSNRI